MKTIAVRIAWMNQLREQAGRLIAASASTVPFELFPPLPE
jgi:hypothetical protein